MKIHRFYIGKPLEDKDTLLIENTELAHQMKNVLRMDPGDSAVLFDDNGIEYLVEIISIADDVIHMKVAERRKKEINITNDICICSSIIKKDKYEWVLEKCTEIGVSHFIPILTERTEKKEVNFERALKIIKEAAEQSGRVDIPKISDEVKRLENIFVELSNEKLLGKKFAPVVLHIEGKPFDKNEILNIAKEEGKKDKKEIGLAVFIGPEGGWSASELAFFKERGLQLYSLGNQILKAETAAIAISALLLL
ncbi:MAG: RsmE family RNA methyltransferase [bacterium]|nr:RsmE family RNA methyltransferase [bacterium]